jgi:hypothetical protein
MRTLDYEKKTRVIQKINSIQPKFRYTIYYRELEQMKKKYIYKDISENDFKRDLRTLKLINDISIINKK